MFLIDANRFNSFFTQQECTVIQSLLNGLTITDISIKTHRSVKTISTQKCSAYRKLGVRNDIAMLKMLMEKNIVSVTFR